MIGKKLPVFQSGKILTRDMLQALTDYSVGAGELRYSDYSDGILCGCELTTTHDRITVHPGILIFHGQVYFITENYSLPYEKTNEWMLLKVRLCDVSLTENFRTEELEIVLEPESMLRDTDIELCRFKLQHGAKLRTSYRNFADMETEYDTMHYTYAKWAACKTPSLSPVILRLFYDEAVKCDLSENCYLDFCMRIADMKQQTLNANVISLFAANALKQPYKELTNEEMYQSLKTILSMLKGHGGPAKRRAFGERKLIVD